VKPRRAYEIAIRISASTWPELVKQLDNIIFDLSTDGRRDAPSINVVHGGEHSSYTIYGEHRPEITTAMYFAAVDQYVKEHTANRGI
jgi:hypothetical protein